MSWCAPARCAQWLFVLFLAASSVGCPELNQWSGPGYQQDPFMNVADDIDEPVSSPKPQAVSPETNLTTHWYDAATEEAQIPPKGELHW